MFLQRMAAANLRFPETVPSERNVPESSETLAPCDIPTLDDLTLRFDALRGVAHPDQVPSQEELEERLRKLKERDFVQIPKTDEPLPSDKMDLLIKQLTDEAKIDMRAGYHSDEAKDSADELPWCCICNEDANLRCVDCDEDLFCHPCFRRSHRNREMKSHRTELYSPKPKLKLP
ncbi:unnamed protein product [Dicrocoelium dendriticum]|nr:unnamed protein product [Dicrocoelium dendriticum]